MNLYRYFKVYSDNNLEEDYLIHGNDKNEALKRLKELKEMTGDSETEVYNEHLELVKVNGRFV